MLLHVHWHRTNTPQYVTAVAWADLTDGRQRKLDYDAAGRLVTETTRSSAATAAGPTTMRTLTFEYGSKTWSVRTASGECPSSGCPRPPDPSGACGCDLDPFTTFSGQAHASLLDQGTIHGRPTLHLRFVTDVPLPSTIDMWIDRSTYLPAFEKVAFRDIGGNGQHPRPVGPTITVTNDFTWLPRTRANLAHFGVVIPPGFKPAPPSS